jgi:DNA-binding transcriptional ArsR family regulator
MMNKIFMNETSISLANLALGMGNEVRLQVLRELAAGEALMTVELAERVGTSASNLFHHMKKLLDAGMVQQNRAGLYSIPPQYIASTEERLLDYGTCLLRLKP